MVKETKFYDLLGVPPDASDDQIKKAYRKKALALHPDREQDEQKKKEKEKLFAELSNANEVLTDPEMRAKYDRFGAKGLEEGGGGGGDGGDLFSAMFGGGGRRREMKPKDTMHQLEVTMEQFYTGTTRKLMIRRHRLCATCSGKGTKSGKDAKCKSCDGRGVKTMLQQIPGFPMSSAVQVTCRDCGGTGILIAEGDKCTACNGERVVEDKKVFEVHVDPGMKEGNVITFTGEGNQIPDVKLAGDVVIVLSALPHDRFERKGNCLRTKASVSLVDALVGFELSIEHLDGRILVVKPTEGQILKPRTTYIVHREGMPIKGTGRSEKGELIIDLTIDFPSSLTEAQQEKLRAVLGRKTEPLIPDRAGAEGGYETEMTETRASLEALEKEDERHSDDDERMRGGHGGPGVQMGCAQQ